MASNGRSKPKCGQGFMADGRNFKPSPENAILYKERTPSDSDFARLVEGIDKDGVKNPILVSLDDFVVSGHQRQKATIQVGRFVVPIIRLDISRAHHTSDSWLAVL